MKTLTAEEARALRLKGKSIKYIAGYLKVSPSSVSRWCSDIRLTQLQKARLMRHQRKIGLAALAPYIELNRAKKRLDILTQGKEGRKDLKKLTKRDLFILGLGLYWGEGYKRGSDEWGFTNSDPMIIRTVLDWLRVCYNVPLERVHGRLTINSIYRKEATRLVKKWAEETGIPQHQFDDSTFITGYGKPGRDSATYRGTLRIKVRNGTSLRRRILASIAAIKY